jgi:hypothetical protein
MIQVRPLSRIIARALAIVAGITLLVGSIIYPANTYYFHDYWSQLYRLSVFGALIALLAILAGAGLIYVVNRQFPALTTLFSPILLFIAFLFNSKFKINLRTYSTNI